MSYYNQDTVLFVDGEYKKAAEAGTDLFGQTLHYGYGVFEGIRSYHTHNGTRIFKAKEHFERMIYSARVMGIPFQYTVEQLTEISYKVLEMNGLSDAYIRPLVYCPPQMTLIYAESSHLMITAWQWGAYLGDKMLSLVTSPYSRPNPSAFKIEAKVCGHYVNSILAGQDARSKGYDEALLLDTEGHVAEGPGANFFVEKNGVIYTPTLGHILPGITRATVLELCREQGIEVEEVSMTIEQARHGDAAFMCGTAAEVIGVRSLDGRDYPMKWEDTVSSRIQQAYRQRVHEEEVTVSLKRSASLS
jgi:branched-chain amino acid aminotransferase